VQRITCSLEAEGFIVLTGIREGDLEGIAEELGPITMDPRNPDRVRTIRPERANRAPANTLSQIHGVGPFPFHSDCAHWNKPATYLALYCVDPGEGERPTFLLDSWKWVWSANEKTSLCSDVWSRALRTPRLCTLANMDGGNLRLRFDDACMRPMTEPARAIGAAVRQKISEAPSHVHRWTVGALLVLDNRRMLHSRGASLVFDPRRQLKRVLIGGEP
jgi:L-asparagine oxygenase